MTTDDRNFRSAYYEKVGCRSVEEKKSLEILLKDRPLNRLKLKQFCLSFTVPAVHRSLLWKLLLSMNRTWLIGMATIPGIIFICFSPLGNVQVSLQYSPTTTNTWCHKERLCTRTWRRPCKSCTSSTTKHPRPMFSMQCGCWRTSSWRSVSISM